MSYTEPVSLTLQQLQLAVENLRTALAQPLDPFTRDAAILRFEHCFALSWKCLRRHLAPDDATVAYGMRELFQQACQHGLIADVEPWLRYLDGCNRIPLSFDSVAANELYATVRLFLTDAERLVHVLHVRSSLASSR